jgi:hypothetical protein
VAAAVLLFFIIEKPLATTTDGEVVTQTLEISGGDAVALTVATIAVRLVAAAAPRIRSSMRGCRH